MHLKNISIRNIRSIRHADWTLPNHNPSAGWHVIIGDNGSGKSTFLRAVALAMIGPAEPGALRQDWASWLSKLDGATGETGKIAIQVLQHSGRDSWSGTGRTGDGPIHAEVIIHGVSESEAPRLDFPKSNVPKRTLWTRGKGYGWFSAGYGPFRRFEGGDQDSTKNFYAYPEVSRHLSIFGESVALTEALEWLRRLKHQKLETKSENAFFDRVKAFINNTGFLPHGTSLEDVTYEKVLFRDGNGCEVPIALLGDGFRSVLSMSFELLRQLEREFGPDRIFAPEHLSVVDVPGVVLIDEVDAHLHPSWQRRIGKWFTTHFPNMQFIVTTHSPLVCWSSDHGTIYRLPAPGSEEEGRMIEGEEKLRLVNGTVQDAYGTELFGLTTARSPEAQQKIEELAELNVKQIEGGLDFNELARQHALKASLPSTAYDLLPPSV